VLYAKNNLRLFTRKDTKKHVQKIVVISLEIKQDIQNIYLSKKLAKYAMKYKKTLKEIDTEEMAENTMEENNQPTGLMARRK